MIYCVWYPSGGFGHFINAVISLYGVDFKRPKNKKFNTTFFGKIEIQVAEETPSFV